MDLFSQYLAQCAVWCQMVADEAERVSKDTARAFALLPPNEDE